MPLSRRIVRIPCCSPEDVCMHCITISSTPSAFFLTREVCRNLGVYRYIECIRRSFVMVHGIIECHTMFCIWMEFFEHWRAVFHLGHQIFVLECTISVFAKRIHSNVMYTIHSDERRLQGLHHLGFSISQQQLPQLWVVDTQLVVDGEEIQWCVAVFTCCIDTLDDVGIHQRGGCEHLHSRLPLLPQQLHILDNVLRDGLVYDEVAVAAAATGRTTCSVTESAVTFAISRMERHVCSNPQHIAIHYSHVYFLTLAQASLLYKQFLVLRQLYRSQQGFTHSRTKFVQH